MHVSIVGRRFTNNKGANLEGDAVTGIGLPVIKSSKQVRKHGFGCFSGHQNDFVGLLSRLGIECLLPVVLQKYVTHPQQHVFVSVGTSMLVVNKRNQTTTPVCADVERDINRLLSVPS